jgi:multisubunit Na+/H+ antiporter MnhG subunit
MAQERTERVLSRIILPTSGGMIGVCTTLIGLVKVAEGRIGPSRVDEYASLILLLFLTSAITSYLSIRHSERQTLSSRLELVADQCFLAGLFCIALIGLFFAYEIV